MNPDTQRRRQQGREIKERQEVLREILELLPPAVKRGELRLVPGPGGTKYLRGPNNEVYAKFTDHLMAQFFIDSLEYLLAFSAYIGQLESEAFQGRRNFRTLSRVRDELEAAESLGFHTKDGQRRTRAALATLDDRERRWDEDDDW